MILIVQGVNSEIKNNRQDLKIDMIRQKVFDLMIRGVIIKKNYLRHFGIILKGSHANKSHKVGV